MALIPAAALPLSVSGPRITGADGSQIRLAGVNWGGAHQDGLVPAGLDKMHRDDIAARIVSWGMNHVRFPFALGTFVTNSGAPRSGPVATPSITANPDLTGMTPWEVYQACVASLTAHGLAVIPNQHLLFPGWCCSQADNNGLWYNGNWPASTFQACWAMVATALAANPLVIGYDLHNEPRPAQGATVTYPTWGDGNPATDMRLLYEQTAGNLHLIDSSKLMFCEGLSYAGDLTRAGQYPVRAPGVVYSMHDYSWYSHPPGQSLTGYYNQMDTAGGYLITKSIAPLWIGEFGTSLDSHASMTTGWIANFASYANARKLHWCWWELSAQTVKGTEPTTNIPKADDGTRESYGLMAGQDWQGTNTDMIRMLQEIM